MHFTAIAMGTNLGDREENLKNARDKLANFLKEPEYSRIYETEPVGYLEQPWFLNQVCVGETDLYPIELLNRLKEIEKELGRVPGFRFGPRQIDLDIIFFDNWVLFSEILTIPHPRYRERAFVIQPLMEILPRWKDPLTDLSLNEYWAEESGFFSGCRLYKYKNE